MTEFFTSLLKGMLSFSIATLVIVVQPSVVTAADLSDGAIQKELGLPSASLEKAELAQAKKLEKPKEMKAEGTHSQPVMAAPVLVAPKTKK